MADEQAQQTDTAVETPSTNPWEGVPAGCATPRSWTPFYLGLAGFGLWLCFLLTILYIRWQTSPV